MEWWQENAHDQRVLTSILVVIRIAGFVATAFSLGAARVPLSVRFAIAVAISFLLIPTQVSTELPGMNSWPAFFLAITSEGILGAIMGSLLGIVVSSIAFGGSWIAQQAGWSVGDLFASEHSLPSSELGRWYGLFAVSIFFLISGHRMMIGSLLETFRMIPAGEVVLTENQIFLVHELVGRSLHLTVQVATPVVLTLLLASVSLGVINRFVPQLHFWAIGLPFRALLGMALVSISLMGVVFVLQNEVPLMLEQVSREILK